MKCTSCGAEIPAGQKFCSSCGAPAQAPTYCTNCGTEVPPGTKFCTSCGATLGVGGAAPGPAPQAPYQAPPAAASAPQFQPAPPAYAPPSGYYQAPTWAPEYKGLGPRLGGFVVDLILYFVFAAVMANFLGKTTSNAGGGGADFNFSLQDGPALLSMGLWFVYHVVMEGTFGWTIDKLIFGMRIVNQQGGAIGIGGAFARNLVRIVDFLPLFYVLGGILVATSGKKQRLGDRVAGSYVVSSRSAGAMKAAYAR